jgi:glycosyltransferase involved in cell wall biosynthesis
MAAYPVTRAFRSVTIILPVMDEVHSLKTTAEMILASSADTLREFLIVVCDRTKPQSMAVVAELAERDPERVVVHHQTMPFLGGAIREAFDRARGSHVIMMASDLETDPADVPTLIAEARRRPDAIITASRWRRGGRFQGYSRVKLAANWMFQRAFSALFGTTLSDMTYGYRLFPTRLVQSIKWEELRHPFLFETLIKPLRLGVEVIEVPSVWKARTEGRSNNSFLRNFEYFRTGLRVRFAPRGSMLRS